MAISAERIAAIQRLLTKHLWRSDIARIVGVSAGTVERVETVTTITRLTAKVKRLQAMMCPLVFANPESQEWAEAMDAIGYYVTDELGLTEDDWRGVMPKEPIGQ